MALNRLIKNCRGITLVVYVERTQDALLVGNHEISPDEKPKQVTVSPNVGEAEIPPLGVGLDGKSLGIVRHEGQ